MELLAALAVVGVLSAAAVPTTSRRLGDLRMRGDARAISSSIAVARMLAAAASTRARIFVDLGTSSFFLQTWDRTTNAWLAEGGVVSTSRGVVFGFGALTAPPPTTQPGIAQSPPCTDNGGNAIANTACIVFNSRGVPVDGAGAPTNGSALYVTDGTGVYAATVTAGPLVRLWWSPASAAAWTPQ
jgi:type II secretory pathway pseudopilin PulG